MKTIEFAMGGVKLLAVSNLEIPNNQRNFKANLLNF